MNANELTFGVEFEVTLPRETVEVGSYSQGRQIAGLPEGWVAKHDGSIRAGRGREGVEIVSPVLKGADGIRQIKTVCEWMTEKRATVNRSTGFHVHVGWSGDEDALLRLAFLAANHEKALYATTGTKMRERNYYCRPVQTSADYIARFKQGQGGQVADRYHLLNLTNLRPGGKQTVEFRCFAGTINLSKVLGHLRLCLGIVEKAITSKRMAPWLAKKPVESSPIHRSGEGQTELTRLFYALGWTKGRQPTAFGDVNAENCPTIAKCKKKLMEMARKYDGQQ